VGWYGLIIHYPLRVISGCGAEAFWRISNGQVLEIQKPDLQIIVA
jgi:hypothetical protein